MEKNLNAPTKLHNLYIKNAMIRSATNENMAQNDHTPSDKLILYYEQLAKRVGLIITGFCYPEPKEIVTDYMLGLFEDTQIPQYAYLCKQVHTYHSKILLQIVAGGNHKTRSPMDYSLAEIQRLPQVFLACANRAHQAGFDGVQLHFAHGYVLSQFLTPCRNTRTDLYGGSYENRTRIHKEIVKILRNLLPKEFHISIKIHCDDFIEEGFTLAQCIRLSQELETIGLDSIEVSGGNYRSLTTCGYYIKEATTIAQACKLAVFAVGGHTNRKDMQEYFKNSNLQALSMSRAITNNMQFVDDDKMLSVCTRCGKCFTLGTPCTQHLAKRTLFATDFDGTLSKDHHTITTQDIECIKTFANDNVFGIVSGRDPISLQTCLSKVHLPYDFLVCFNGALCLDLHGAILHDEPILEDLHTLVDFLSSSDALSYHVIGYQQVLLQYANGVDKKSVCFEEIIYKDYAKVTTLHELDKIYLISCEFTSEKLAKQHADYINAHFPYVCASANTNFIDIMKIGISKAKGMEIICSYFRMKKDAVSVIGDSYNDIEMIEHFHGYAIKGNVHIEEVAQHKVNSVQEAITHFVQKNTR